MDLTERSNTNKANNENSIDKKETEFNISYILIKIDDNIIKKKYLKIVKEIIKIEKDNKDILSIKENIKYYVYLFEIKILCLCRFIDGKISEFFKYKKSSLVFGSTLENMKSLEKALSKMENILKEDMSKLKKYINDKSIISENMKEHIILSYTRAIYLQGKYCKLKNQIADAASFFNMGINILNKNIKKSIESETFSLYAKYLLSLSCILIEDNSYSIACKNLVISIKYFIKSLFQVFDNYYGINIDEKQMKNKNNIKTFSFKGLIICLFLLGICLEKMDRLDKAITLYGETYWLSEKLFQNVEPIFFSIIKNINIKINKYKEDIIKGKKSKSFEGKKKQKMEFIKERNFANNLKLTNISNKENFNSQKYLKMESKIKNILNFFESKFRNKNKDEKNFLTIIKYFNLKKNIFNFTSDYLVKEKQKLMEKTIKLKNSKNINSKTEDNIIINKKKLVKNYDKEYPYRNIITNENNNNQHDNTIKVLESKKNNIKQKNLFKEKNLKLINEQINKNIMNFHFNTISNINKYPKIIKSKSHSNNVKFHKTFCFNKTNQNLNNYGFQTIKVRDEGKRDRILSQYKYDKNRKIKPKYLLININKKLKDKQKEFITKNSFIFSKNFKKDIQYLENMDKKEMKFQKQLLNLRYMEEEYNDQIGKTNYIYTGLNKDKIKENANNIYLRIKDKIDDKLNINNGKEISHSENMSKKIDKILKKRIKLENNIIIGLNDFKLKELKKLNKSLKETKRNTMFSVLNNNNFRNQKKTIDIDLDIKLMTEINHTNRKNNEIIGFLNNEIIRCDEKSMRLTKRKNNFNI